MKFGFQINVENIWNTFLILFIQELSANYAFIRKIFLH